MLHVISLYSRFTLSFKSLYNDRHKISDILVKNGFIHQEWRRTPFDNYVEFRIDCNIRQAEVIRRLIKHFKIYE